MRLGSFIIFLLLISCGTKVVSEKTSCDPKKKLECDPAASQSIPPLKNNTDKNLR